MSDGSDETVAPTSAADPPATWWSRAVTAGALRRSVVVFLALYPLVAVWALVNPMFASPDETLHMARAQSFARLDFANPYTTDGLPIESIDCFRFQENVTAACQDLTWGEDGTERVVPDDGYPPLFHAIAAVPAIVVDGLEGAYLMRLWVAAVTVALVAWGGGLVTRAGRGPWPLVGYLVAVTPMAVFTMATVNPSGLSVAGALLVTAAVVALCRTPPDREATVAAWCGAAVLALTRRDGLVWLAIIAVCLTPIVPWRRLGARLRHERRWQVALGAATAAIIIAAVGWGRPTASRFFDNWRDGRGSGWLEGVQFIRTFLTQAIGRFGWLDSPIGEEAVAVTFVVAGTIALLALVGRDRRLAWATALSVVALFVTPVAFKMIRADYLQGRYLLPIWAAGLVLAGAAASSVVLTGDARRRLVRVLLALWLIVHATGAVQNLRRYAVGRSGSWDFVSDPEWHPDTMSNIVALIAYLAAFAVATGAILTLLRQTERSSPAPDAVAAEQRAGSDLLGEAAGHSAEDHPADHQAGE